MATVLEAKQVVKFDSVSVKIIHDSDVDLSWLDQYEIATDKEEKKYYKQDQKRKKAFFNNEWCMVGVRVTAKVYINNCLQKFESAGLWGIESDSKLSYFKSVAADEASELKGTLQTLCFSPELLAEFDQLTKQAIKGIYNPY